MSEKIKNIQYITLKETRKIGNFLLDKNIPLPVQFEDGQQPQDLDLTSIAAGLIKIAAWDNDNPNFNYYKDVLLELQPNVIEELNTAAIAKSNKKEFDFALELMLAVNHLSEIPESYINLAVLYAQMTVACHKADDDVKADMYDDKIIEILDICMKKYPDYAPAYSEASAFHTRHGDIESAKDCLEKFIELSKDEKAVKQANKTLQSMKKMLSSKDLVLYAYDKIMMGCPEEAIETIDKFLSENKPTWEAYFIRGWAKRISEDFDNAQKDLLESLRLDSQNAEVYNELSICSRESGNIELAKSYLQIACDLDEENVIYLTNLAFLHLADDEFDESREMIEKARVLDKEDPQLLYIIKEYEERTGEKLGDIISQEVYTDEEFELLHKKEHEEHHHHEEI